MNSKDFLMVDSRGSDDYNAWLGKRLSLPQTVYIQRAICVTLIILKA
jgi:hypothetical protein